jgi:hypothetical protein
MSNLDGDCSWRVNKQPRRTDFLIGDMKRRGFFSDKGQPQVVNDPVGHGIVGEERKVVVDNNVVGESGFEPETSTVCRKHLKNVMPRK